MNEYRIRILKKHEEELHAQGVKSLALFGSVARDEVQEDSDVDLLVEFNRPIGMFHFLRVRRYLSELLGKDVGLVTHHALREKMRDDILKEAIRVA